MRKSPDICPICNRVWKEITQRMREGKTCSKLCSSIKGYLSGDRKETNIELKLQEFLKELNIPFKTQIPLLGITIADIFIAPNIAVFADGEYWHADESKKIKDENKTKKLKKHHFLVLRISETDILENNLKVKEMLIEIYSKRKIKKEL